MLSVLFALLSLGSPAHAQGIIIEVPGSADVPLAMPKPLLPATEPKEASAEVWDAAWGDLSSSGYFKMQAPDSYIEKSTSVEPGQVAFDNWNLIKTAVLVKTRVYPAGHASCDPGGARMCADLYAYYVPTGELLVSKRFRAEPRGSRQLGHAIANAVLEAATGQPGFFGTRIAAVGSRGGNKEIFVMDADGHNATAITRNGSINLSPAWSPDGRSIAWTSYKKANPDLYVKDLPTGRTRMISNVQGINTSASFSPNGQDLAFARSDGGDSDIFIVDARTGAERRQLTRGGGIDISPAYTTDGRIAFSSERGGGSQVYIMPAGGGEASRLTFVGDFNIDPVISPDNTKVAWVGRSQGGFDIYVADLEGRNAIRITQDMGDNEDPTWSPDGKYLMFSSTRTGRSELWVSTADGRHHTQITHTGGWTQPTWMPTP